MSSEKKISHQELTSLTLDDIVDCLPHIAREPLKRTDADFIWKSLVDFYQGVSNVPENILAQLYWVTIAITPEEYANITIASIDTVKNFGLAYNLDVEQLVMIADKVRQDFAGKTPEDYTYYDLKALNQILCVFNRSEIERIHPSAYREAALLIGELRNCSSEVMKGFAKLAVHKDAFGAVKQWTPLIFKTVGNVAKYLPGDFPGALKEDIYGGEDATFKPEGDESVDI